MSDDYGPFGTYLPTHVQFFQYYASYLGPIFAEIPTSVDSEYLLTRVLTREYLFFDTFWDSSLLELDFSFLKILERVEY